MKVAVVGGGSTYTPELVDGLVGLLPEGPFLDPPDEHSDQAEEGRLAELVRRGRRMSGAERDELRRLLAKLGPREFAFAAADRFSPVPLRWLGGRSGR